MSIVGRRGSSGSGWTWSRPPLGPRRPSPLLAVAGTAGLIVLFVAIALLGVWLADRNDNSPADSSPTPTATPTPVVTASPSPPASPTPGPGGQGPLFRLAAWDGERWQFERRLDGALYSEGEAIPFVFSIDRTIRDDTYYLTIHYDCAGFALLTSSDRDDGSGPALARGGPQSAIPDTTLVIPDDPGTHADDSERGSLTLWGGSFRGLTPILPISACTGEKSFTFGVAAAADTLYLMWAAEIAPGAAERDVPLRLAVQAAGAEELTIEIDPDSVSAAQP